MLEAWDAVKVVVEPGTSVAKVKARALAVLAPDVPQPGDVVTKLGGFEIRDEAKSLTAAGVSGWLDAPAAFPSPAADQVIADTATAARTPTGTDAAQLISAAQAMRAEVARRIVGQTDALDEILLAIVAGGHALLVGVPGLAKTMMVRAVSEAMQLDFRRIQFTPDLVPSDITGTELLEEDSATGQRAFRFVRGPIFANIVLADEINRAPPRTQAALLEAMQEYRVTAAGQTMPLPSPFFVLATQNPIEQEGTYPLPKRNSIAFCSTSASTIRVKTMKSGSCAARRARRLDH